MNNGNNSGGGIGVLGMLGVVFITLKLTGVIDWSWWWVTAPFWGGIALVAVIGIVLFLIGVATMGFESRKRKRK